MSFEKPDSLFLLFLLIPLLILVLHDRRISKSALSQIIGQEVQFERKMFSRWLVSSVLVVFALCSLVLCLARPTYKVEAIEDTREGIHVLLGLDVSKSMEAQDTPPNRLERAKLIYESLVEKIDFNKLSIMLIRGQATMYLPFTSDLALIKKSIIDLRKEYISKPGSDVMGGLELGRHVLSTQPFSHQIALIASDGDGVDGEQLKAEVQRYQTEGIRLVILGMGGHEAITQVDQGQTHSSQQSFDTLLAGFQSDSLTYIDTNALTVDEVVSKLSSIINQETNRNTRMVPLSLRFYFIVMALLFFVASLLIRPIKWRIS